LAKYQNLNFGGLFVKLLVVQDTVDLYKTQLTCIQVISSLLEWRSITLLGLISCSVQIIELISVLSLVRVAVW